MGHYQGAKVMEQQIHKSIQDFLSIGTDRRGDKSPIEVYLCAHEKDDYMPLYIEAL